jgi:hypothetical protein
MDGDLCVNGGRSSDEAQRVVQVHKYETFLPGDLRCELHFEVPDEISIQEHQVN